MSPCRRALVLAIIALAALAPSAHAAGRHAVAAAGTWRIVAPHRQAPLFHEAAGIGIDRRHDVSVADPTENRVRTFSPTGKLLAVRSIGALRGGPASLAVAPDGTRYVLTAPGIAVLSPAGAVKARWVNNATGVAVGGSGNVFLLYAERTARGVTPAGGYARVEKRSPAGRLLGSWRSPFIEALAVAPDGIAVDPRGNVYVTVGTDTTCYKACIPQTSILFRLSPSLSTSWTFQPANSAPFGAVGAVDGTGAMYLRSGLSGVGPVSVIKLSSTGRLLHRWTGTAAAPLGDDLRLILDNTGRLYVAASRSSGLPAWARSGKIVALNAAWKTVSQWGRFLTYAALEFPMDLGLTTGPDGTLYMTGGPNSAIYTVLSTAGTIVRSVGHTQTSGGGIADPRSIAVDAAKNVYVVDGILGKVVKYSPDGRVLLTFLPPKSQSAGLDAIALDAAGDVFVTSMYGGHIYKWSPKGLLRDTLGSIGSAPGQFSAASGIAIDTAGNLYVGDAYNNRVQKLSPTGAPLAIIGGPSIFDRPTRVALGPNGDLFVADLTHNTIREFSPGGTLVRTIGVPGIWTGQLDQPIALAFDSHGTLYVNDYGNDRIQAYTPK